MKASEYLSEKLAEIKNVQSIGLTHGESHAPGGVDSLSSYFATKGELDALEAEKANQSDLEIERSRISNLTAAAQEVVDARGSSVSLGTRLNGVDSQLAESASQIQAVENSKADKTEVEVERQRINNLVANAGDTDNNAELLDLRVDAHSRIYPTAGEAVRAIGKNFKNSINLLNLNTTTPNQTIRFDTGAVGSSGLYFTTDYIAVRPGHVLIVTRQLPHPTPIQGYTTNINPSYHHAAVYDNEKNFIPGEGNQSHHFYYNDTESLQYVRFSLPYSLTNFMIEELPYTNFDYWYSRDYVAYDETELDPHAFSTLDYIETAVTNNCLMEYSEFHAKALAAGTYKNQPLKYFTVNAGEKYTLSIGDVINNPDASDVAISAVTLNGANEIVRRKSCSQNSKTSFTINEGELFMYVMLRLNTETPIEEETLVTFKDVMLLKGDKRYELHDDLLPSFSTAEFLGAPQNYFMQEVEETADTILSKMGNECLVLNVLTDTHLSIDDENKIRINKNTYENIKAVNERVYSDGIVHLGDLNLPSPKITTQFVANQLINIQRSYMAQANENVYMVIGNHDGVLGGFPVEKTVYGALSKHNEKYVTREANNDYFYADFTKLKIRCIFLATSQIIVSSVYGCSATQVEWLAESLNTGDDWSVMVFSHISPFYADRQTDPQLQGAFVNKAAVVGLLNAYDNHTQYSDGTYSADFSGYTSTKLVSWVCGHAHIDYINSDNDLGRPVITLAPAGLHYPAGVVPETAIVQSREDYDVTQDLWSTLIYRPDEDKLYVVRFGAGEDQTIDL